MSHLGVVEDTLFVPMLGRIYASEHCPNILYDQKALELKKKLPSGLPEQDGQSQYTLLASAARSANMDRFIRAFLERRPDGVIVQLGCGLETAYFRCDNGRSRWYAVDLPHVVEYRRELLPEPERETYLAGDAFAEDWIRQIRADVPDARIDAAHQIGHLSPPRLVGAQIVVVLRPLPAHGDDASLFQYLQGVGDRRAGEVGFLGDLPHPDPGQIALQQRQQKGLPRLVADRRKGIPALPKAVGELPAGLLAPLFHFRSPL